MHFVCFVSAETVAFIAVFILCTTSSSTGETRSSNFGAFDTRFVLPYTVYKRYSAAGDVNIGALMSITDNPKDLMCTEILRQDPWLMPAMEAIAYAVDIINRNPALLPTVTLGFVIVDYCRSSSIALAQTLSFLPVASSMYNSSWSPALNSSKDVDPRTLTPMSVSSIDSMTTIDPILKPWTVPLFKPLPHYDVVGVLGPQASTSTIYMSSLLSVARLPTISYMATSDELSNKFYHPYLLRLVPPDKHQVHGMLTFIADNGWTYISVVHGDTTYGDTAFDTIKASAPRFNICVATSHRVNVRSDFDFIIRDLLSHQTARVVILFAETDPILNLLAASRRVGARGHFIWIGSDSLADKIILRGQYFEELHGAFTFMYYSKRVPAFEKYFKQLRPNTTTNPWFRPFWQMLAQCSFSNDSCWSQKSIAKFQNLNIPSSVSLVIDSVFTFAYGVHNLLTNVCPTLVGHDARLCITGDVLLNYMLNYSFNGFTSTIAFDKNGDLIGKYVIRQILYDDDNINDAGGKIRANLIETQVACYETKGGTISYRGPSISWDHLTAVPRLIPLEEGSQNANRPESVCSRPCRADQYIIQKEIRCCWECGSCRANEKLINQNKACEKCQQFTWPDPASNFTKCVPIRLTHPSARNTVSIIAICIVAVCIVCWCGIAAMYIRCREHSVIKAASRELSALQMIGILFAYVSVVLLQTMPTHTVCGVIYLLFCLSFACLYSPLIVKAVRIYRIFLQGSQGVKDMKWISPQSQLMLVGVLITVQMLVSSTMYVVHRPSAHITQPVELENFVELYCEFTPPSVTSFLAVSLLQVTVSLVLAFKTRKLPDNFKESKFVTMCASTTLIIWLTIVPAYYTANVKFIRALLHSLALLLNHTVALIFLFLPKVFVIFYVDHETEINAKFHTSHVKKRGHFPDIANRVTPTTTEKPPILGRSHI